MRLILASASPRRAELLRAAGYEFDVVPAHVDESLEPGEVPARYVRRLAAAKSAAAQKYMASGFPPSLPHESAQLRRDLAEARSAEAGSRTADDPPEGGHHVRGEAVVLGADTVVVVDGRILGKPTDDADAARMLRLLSSRHHQVLTGISVRRGAHELGRVETTDVQFSQLTSDEIAWYIASGEGRDKAGAYAIQGLASRFIPRLDGSYSNVVGLPIACVRDLLTEISSTRPPPPSATRSGAG